MVETTSGYQLISSKHLAKGLKFRAGPVMAYDDEVVPFLELIKTVANEMELENIYNRERHLL